MPFRTGAAGAVGGASGFSRIVQAQQKTHDPNEPPPVATFSILGYDPETGEVGGAVQSRVFTLTGVLTADADADGAHFSVRSERRDLEVLREHIAQATGTPERDQS